MVRGLGLGLLFLCHLLLARLLGSRPFGVYIYAFTWLSVIILGSKLTLDMCMVRWIASYRAESRWSLLRGLLSRSRAWTLGLSTGMGVLALVALLILRGRLQADLETTFWIALAALPIAALRQHGQSSLRGFKRVVRAEIPEAILRPVLLAASALCVFAATDRLIDAPLTMALLLGSEVVCLALASMWLHGAQPAEIRSAAPEYSQREWFTVSWPLLLVAGFAMISQYVDSLMIGIFRGPESAAYYVIASRLSILVSFALGSAISILSPMISEYHTLGQRDRLQRMLTVAARAVALYTILVTALVVGLGRFVLSLFGTGFPTAYEPLLILVGGQAVNSLCGPVGALMVMTRYQVRAAWIIGISAAANIGLNAALIPLWGLHGAAVSTAFTTVLWNVWMLVTIARRLGYNPTVFSRTPPTADA